MGEAIGQSLPLAIGVALSPVSIIAVVVLLTSSRARCLGPVFVLGWLLGLVVVGARVLAVVGPSGAGSSAQRTRWVSWVMIVLGVLLLVDAGRRLGGRTGTGEEVPLPAWMGAIDQLKPAAALGGGVLLGGVRAKSLLLVVGGAAAIAQTGIGGGQQAIAYAVFAVIATIGVGAPVVIYFAMGTRSGELLGRLKGWMRRNNAVILGSADSHRDPLSIDPPYSAKAEEDQASDTTTTTRLDTLRPEHVIEPAAELRVSITNEEAHPSSSFVQGQQQVARLLGDPGGIGIGGHAGHMDPAGVQLDEEQHIQPPQPDGVDGEEITGHDPSGLLAQKRPPGRIRPPWRRVQPVAVQRRADRGRRNPNTKVQRLALDALVAQRGFSMARRMISCWMSWSSGGRPCPRRG
jgi:hypothetical protein